MFRLNDTLMREKFGALHTNGYLNDPELIAADSHLKIIPGPSTNNGYKIYNNDVLTAFLDYGTPGLVFCSFSLPREAFLFLVINLNLTKM